MNSEERRLRSMQQFVERASLLFEELGVPRMAGRIFGWALVWGPPHPAVGFAQPLSDYGHVVVHSLVLSVSGRCAFAGACWLSRSQ